MKKLMILLALIITKGQLYAECAVATTQDTCTAPSCVWVAKNKVKGECAEIAVNASSPTFTSTAPIAAEVGTAYSYSIITNDINGDTVDLSAPILPSWLSLNGTTLSGTPTASDIGNNNVTLMASDGTNDVSQTFIIKVSAVALAAAPYYQNEYSCGVFSNVLTSYDSVTSNGNNDRACNTENISYPEGALTGEVSCYIDAACGGIGSSCDRVDPPTNRYGHAFPTNSKSGTSNGSPTNLTDLEYGNLDYNNKTVTFNPLYAYSDSTTKVMLLGDVNVASSELRFEPGDYYFDSLTINSNSNDVILPHGGPVRIFIKGNLAVAMNNLHFNSTGSENNLFVYVAGNFESIGNGGGTTEWKAFMYVEGSVTLNNNSNNWKIYGGITAEGPITIGGNNPDFIGTGNAGVLGLGDCALCFEQPVPTSTSGNTQVETQFINNGGVTLTELNITKAYDYTVGNISSSVVSANALAYSSFSTQINVDLDGFNHFQNPSTKYGYIYTIGDYNDGQADTLTDTTNISFILNDYNTSNQVDLKVLFLGDYMDGDRRYHVAIDRCGEWPIITNYLSGPYDAWDTYRGDTNNDAQGLIDDKNISTKIANKAFNLTIANLDSTGTKLETKNVASTVTYGLYNSSGLITGTVGNFETNNTSSKTHTFTVPSASSQVYVGFKFCSSYNDNLYTLSSDSACSGISIACDAISTTPAWRICYSSDAFAIRPDKFEMTTSDDIELLKSGAEYQFTVAAKNDTDTDTTDYNQTKANLDLNKTLILKNGTPDTSGLLSGNLNFSGTDFSFDNGISLIGGNNAVVGIVFDDIGNVAIGLQDKNWAEVDSDDTPQNCIGGTFNNGLVDLMVPEGAYVCGEKNATFIPDHFSLEYATLNNNHLVRPFTYLTYNDDLNMSAVIEVKILAKNANDEITQNFRGGQSTVYYENPMEVNLTIPTQNSTGAIIDNGHGAALNVKKHDINTSTYLGFGGDDANGTHAISWDDSNTEQRLMFNYNKEINHPINPFDINMSTATTTAQKVRININSRYPESGVTSAGHSINVIGEANATGAATFYFARTRASKDLYDDVVDSVITPISIDVYCALGFTQCADLGIDTMSAQIDDFDWWLSLDHNMSAGDGNVTLKTGTTIEGSSLDWDVSPKIVAINSSGIDGNIPVTDGNATVLPLIVGIDLDETNPTKTSSWLIYNKDSAYGTPSPFYKVRFIGVESGWAGYGDTGHVVDSSVSTKKNKRLSW